MKKLIKGNVAIAEAAIQAGCRFYAGYPITPQNEIPEYMSHRLPEVGGIFIQAESELAAINLVYGASIAGAKAMTSSSSPGISLMQECISYMAGCEISAVIVNVVRGGPGLGSIGTSQGDYFQATRGGGHGDYRMIVLSPSTIQEAIILVQKAFDLAEKYRSPIMILSEAAAGQMMESVEFPPISKVETKRDWILDGCMNREPRFIKSLYLAPGELEKHNLHLNEKYERMKNELLYEAFLIEDAEIIAISYGICGRIVKGACKKAREKNIKVGMIRPITLWPFPYEVIRKASERTNKFLVVELSLGQMIDDVLIALEGNGEVYTYFRPATVITPEEVLEKIEEIHTGKLKPIIR
jgi:2-oxoglutarate ferredoxin oxidoreductase subunit alpha